MQLDRIDSGRSGDFNDTFQRFIHKNPYLGHEGRHLGDDRGTTFRSEKPGTFRIENKTECIRSKFDRRRGIFGIGQTANLNSNRHFGRQRTGRERGRQRLERLRPPFPTQLKKGDPCNQVNGYANRSPFLTSLDFHTNQRAAVRIWIERQDAEDRFVVTGLWQDLIWLWANKD